MSDTLTGYVTLVRVSCWCGYVYAIPADYKTWLLQGPRVRHTYCPMGHEWHYIGKSDAEKERERRESAERRVRNLEENLNIEKAAHSITKGKLTKTRNRIAKGICPHCHRTFANVARHMATKHPMDKVPA